MEFTEGQAPSVKNGAERSRQYRQTDKGKRASRQHHAAWRATDAGRASKRRENQDARLRRWLAKPFVAWDGEGVTRGDDGHHDYLMLANSNGALITDPDYLPTERIFEFALESNTPGTINVIYGAGYDWNMWLTDIPQEFLQVLYDDGAVTWRDWRITWRRGKTFHLSRGGESILFYDVISFFQCAFVKACDSYLGEEFEHRDMIVENKRLRSGFRASDVKEIIEYNHWELVNLVKLMTEFRIRLDKVNLRPGRWDGPGAIAVSLLKREGVGNHMQQSPDEVMPAVRSAYFGGRFEVVRSGHVNGKAYEYDINSAYPWGLCDVPSLAGGSWNYVDGDPGHQDFAIYHLRYDGVTSPAIPQPLPCRFDTGNTAYPSSVEGWYWTPEYDVAHEYIAIWGGTVTVIGAWVFTPATDTKPFAFIRPLFAERRALKAAGDGAHMGIKLGLNSLYGKLAQQVGWRVDRKGQVHIPPYHQLEWAGYVTSKCRAAVLRVTLDKLDYVIAWETDAMFVSHPLDVTEGAGLGEWEYDAFTSLTYLQSGMYFATKTDGTEVAKTRGVDLGNLTRERVLEGMRANALSVPAQLSRFTGLGLALQGQWNHWRKWETMDKNIKLVPSEGKRWHMGCSACTMEHGFTVGAWHNTVIAGWAIGHHVSREYEVEWQNPGLMSEKLSKIRQGHYEEDRYND